MQTPDLGRTSEISEILDAFIFLQPDHVMTHCARLGSCDANSQYTIHGVRYKQCAVTRG